MVADLQEVLNLVIQAEQLALKRYENAGPDVPGSMLVAEDVRLAALALGQAHAHTSTALLKLGVSIEKEVPG